ncbi:hypothetical protein [Photobacterium sanguinicancri]|uniref:hypothetical protein n=1 Tax=Photobacterium sanguinicancri TaxID=875932 RepID=UPI00138F53EC
MLGVDSHSGINLSDNTLLNIIKYWVKTTAKDNVKQWEAMGVGHKVHAGVQSHCLDYDY